MITLGGRGLLFTHVERHVERHGFGRLGFAPTTLRELGLRHPVKYCVK